MNKCLFFLFITLCSAIFATPIVERGVSSIALTELTSALGIAKDANLVEETQKQWLRKTGKERWEMEELSAEKRQFVLNWADKQGIFSACKPTKVHYDKVLILGATTPNMQKRLLFVKKLWQEGVRFEELVWLTGDRPLDPKIDTLCDRCKTESEAAHILWEETDLPSDLRSIPVVFLATAMKEENGVLKRPNTEDTLITWLSKTSAACSTLFISQQPFCSYQYAIVKKCLPKEFLFDCVGDGIENTTSQAASVVLDSIARWLYVESNNSHQSNGM